MLDEERAALSKARLEHANECLAAAKQLSAVGNYRSAANRAYYSAFHAMRAVLAFDDIDMKKHSGIISEFRRLYIKTGLFDAELSNIISALFDLRTDSDYDDFFVISKAEVIQQIEDAEHFVGVITEYLTQKKYN